MPRSPSSSAGWTPERAETPPCSWTTTWARRWTRISSPAPRVRPDGRLVSHRPGGDVHRRVLAQHARRLGLERDDGGVVAPDVVAHLRLGHRAPHLRRRPRDGVGAEVDGSHRAHSILTAVPRRAADYPPPVRVREFVAAPEAGEDERIDVGVLFVGGGPAGIAGAIRLGQLLADDPATGGGARRDADRRRRQGPGRRRPPALRARSSTRRALRDLLPGTPLESLPGFGPVRREAVYLMRPGYARAAADAAALPQQGQLDLLAGAARPPPRGAGRGAGGDGAARDGRADAARRGRRRPGHRHGRQGPRPRGGADGGVRAGDRDPGPRDGAVRGDAGAPRGRSGRGVQPAHREPAGLEPGRQGGVEGGPPAQPGDPHARMAASLGGEARRDRRQLHLPDGRRPADDRARGRARAPRRLALGARSAPAVQDPPDDPRAARGRRARGLGGEDDPRGRLLSVPDRISVPGRSSRATRRAS